MLWRSDQDACFRLVPLMPFANALFDVIRTSCEARADAAFAILPDGRVALSYRDSLDRSGQYANVLLALGVTPGARVAVQVEKNLDALMLYLATVRIGAIFLPLNTGYTPAELSYFLNDAEPHLFVCDPAKREALAGITKAAGARLETLGGEGDESGSLTGMAAAAHHDAGIVARGADDLAAILYTSGTTGRSKGAMLSHDNLLSNALTLAALWRFGPQDRLIHALPIYHTHGLFVATNIALVTGSSLIFLPKFDADAVMQAMPQASAMMGVPTFYTRLLQHPGLTRDRTAHMRLFVSGSAPLLAETHRAWQEKTGHAILERYGMTETNMNASNPYEGERIAGTVGFALPDVALRIVDPETGKALPQGEIGMIEVKGPNVFKGYWRMPEKTASEFRADGFFITGDLGLIDAKGYVQIVGRGKDLVISGGFNVYPKEIETEIDAISGVVESAVIGVPHPDFGEGVTAVVVAQTGSTLDEAAILTALDGRLAKFKMPKRVIFVLDLPRNTMGKVQKNILRDTYRSLYEPA
jgi:malonyl-CoA/methylmalonyl-CoA synthetase